MLLPNNALLNVILSLFVVAVDGGVGDGGVGDYASFFFFLLFAVSDNLPAFSDHHANPDPGLAAVLGAFLSHRRGKWPADRLLRRAVEKRVSFSPLSHTLLYRGTFWGSSDC